MAVSLNIDELKNRMLNVFGKFLLELDLFPKNKLPSDYDFATMTLSKVSK